MKKVLYLLMIASSAVLLVSCAMLGFEEDKMLDVNKILELKPEDKIYTAHNIWFDDKNEIFQVHYHRGKILPLGTEVKILEAYQFKLVFKDVSTGETYKVSVQKKFATSKTEGYVKRIFTTKTQDQLVQGIAPPVLASIKKGVVEKGMSKNEVILSYGYPSPHRTPSINEDTWIYFNTPVDTDRVMFNRKGLVVDIVKHQEVKK